LRSRSTASSIVSRFWDEVKNVVLERFGQVLRVDPRLAGDLAGQRLAKVLRQALGLGRLARHQGVGLDVEREVGRCPLDPQLGGPARRQRVVRGVDLDEREARCVVLEALLGAVGRGRVEDAGRGHRRVGPGRRADTDHAAVRRRDGLGGDVRIAVEGGRCAVRAGVVRVRRHALRVLREPRCDAPATRPSGPK
jgi:hypothetical protein